jgi:hypothetical protein
VNMHVAVLTLFGGDCEYVTSCRLVEFLSDYTMYHRRTR